MKRLAFLPPLLLIACSGGLSDVEGNVLGQPEALYIAPDDLVDDVQVLADWRCRSGLPAHVVPLSDAVAQGDGPDDAAALRDYLRQRWEADGIEYVVLAGDAGAVPIREVFASVTVDAEGVYEETDIATDLYFADLDGDWDPDGDGAYGEPEDDADLLPDIAIGRLPVETSAEVEAYADKLRAYERTPRDDYQDRVLLSASWAASIGSTEIYASDGIEYFVVPNLPDHLTLDRLYEDYENWEEEGAGELTAENWTEALADGHAITFHMGHGNEETLGPLQFPFQFEELDNYTRPTVLITCECSGGRFIYENDDSSGEKFVQGAAGGVIYMGSTDLGIGFPSYSRIMQQLAADLWADDEGPVRMGQAVRGVMRAYDEQDILHTEGHVDRWQQMVTVLLGDPTLPLWTDVPQMTYLDAEVGGAGVTFTLTDRSDDPVAGATVTAHLSGEYLLMQTTDGSGQATFEGGEDIFADAIFTTTGPNLVPQQWEWGDR